MNYLEKSCKVTPDFGNITHSSSFTIANQQLSGFITIYRPRRQTLLKTPKQNRFEESLGHLRIFPWKFLTLKVWIFIYSNNYDFVPLPLPSRYRYSVTVIHRQPPLPNITDRHGPSPNVTERYKRYPALPSVTQRYPALPSVTERYPALLNVTERYWTLPSVTERYPALLNVTEPITFSNVNYYCTLI